MKTLRLQHGDLVPGTRGLETVSGVSMLIQDIRGALGEPYGIDRFHPRWGSVIDDYVGMPLNESTTFDLKGEVNRVIGNYMAVQTEKVNRDAMSENTPDRFRTEDVLARVREVKVSSRYDQATIEITVETASREIATFDIEVEGRNG